MKRIAKGIEIVLFLVLLGSLIGVASWSFTTSNRHAAEPSPNAVSPENAKYLGLSPEEFMERYEGAEAIDRSIERE